LHIIEVSVSVIQGYPNIGAFRGGLEFIGVFSLEAGVPYLFDLGDICFGIEGYG
jgi:hypothetical protein